MRVFEVMDDIYRNNLWNGTESLSGPGSTKEYAKGAGSFIESVIAARGIDTVIDAGCGDHNWIGEYIPAEVMYFGIDASREIIKENIKKHASINKWFTVGDYSSQLPIAVDLIICRHSLQHLSADRVYAALQLFKTYGTWLIATTFDEKADNNLGDCEDGGFYPYNLTSGRFGLSLPSNMIREPNTEYNEYLGLWRI